MRTRLTLLAVAAALLIPSSAHAADTADLLAPAGCAMAHCDQGMSGIIGADAPTGAVSTLWRDTGNAGSGYGLGCSSNLRLAVCSFLSTWTRRTSLRAYRADGTVAWSSSLLALWSGYSAPIVAPDGSTIAVDGLRAVRFDEDGTVLWNQRTPGGIPISPNLLADGRIVLATLNGPVTVLSSGTGATLASRRLTATVDIGGKPVSGSFDTINTPAVRGNRVYVSTQFRDSGGVSRPYGRLYALDVTGSGSATQIETAWTVDFAGPSGASPLLVANEEAGPTVVIDGLGTNPAVKGTPNFMGVRDEGDRGEIVWSSNIGTPALAAATADPRGGAWVFSPSRSTVDRLDTTDGRLIQRIDLDPLVNEWGVHGPSSTMQIAGPPDRPVMLVSATPPSFASSYLVAIDLTTGRLDWKTRVDDNRSLWGVPYGQFPIVQRADGSPVIVFTSYSGGTRGVG